MNEGVSISAQRARSLTGVGGRVYTVGPFADRTQAEEYADWMVAFRYVNIKIERPRCSCGLFEGHLGWPRCEARCAA